MWICSPAGCALQSSRFTYGQRRPSDEELEPGDEEPEVTDKVFPLSACRSISGVNSVGKQTNQRSKRIIAVRRAKKKKQYPILYSNIEVLTCLSVEQSELGVVRPEDAAAHDLQLVHSESVVSFGVLQQNHTL